MAAYRVTGTKKGGLPVEVQRRKHNKTVTLLSLANVRGDHQLLLSHLKTALGTGGAIVDGAIELQGERAEALETWLIAHDAIEGMAKPKAPKAAASPPPPPPSQPTGAHQPAKTRPPDRASRPASTAYGRFVALWKSWPYWDQDWSQLPHRWEAAQAAPAAGNESDLEGGSVEGLAAARAAVRASGGSAHELMEAGLRALCMLAEPSSFRQSRAERAQLHKANAQPPARTSAAMPRPAAAAAAAPPGLGYPPQWSAGASSAAHGWQSHGGGGGGRGGGGRGGGRGHEGESSGSRGCGGRGRVVGVRAGSHMRRALSHGAVPSVSGKGSGRGRRGARYGARDGARDGARGLTSDDEWSDEDADEDNADCGASYTGAPATRLGATQWRLSDHLPAGPGASSVAWPHGAAPSRAGRAHDGANGRAHDGANGRAHAVEEDEALQLALALSLSEGPPAQGRPPPPAPPLPQQRPPQRPPAPLLSPVLAAIEVRLEQQRRAYEQQQQQQQLGCGAVASGVRGAASSAPSWAPPERRPLVTCEELWGDLDEEEALALAIRLSVEAEARRDERARARQHATAHHGATTRDATAHEVVAAAAAEEEEKGEEAWNDEWDGEEEWEEEWQEEWEDEAAWDEGEASWAEGAREVASMAAPSPTLPPGLASTHTANNNGLSDAEALDTALNNGLSDAEALETALCLSREAAARASLPPPRSRSTQARAAAAAAAAAPTLTAWALSRLKQLSMDELVDADVLIQYVLAIEDDAEVTEFVTQFLGERDESFAFALELCERRRQEQTTVDNYTKV